MGPDDTPAGSPADALDADIAALLTGLSGETPDPSAQTPQPAGMPKRADTPAEAASAQQQKQSQMVKLGGREYKSLNEADKAHRALYGKFSENQNLLNWLKTKGLRDPAVLEVLANNPEWGNIAAKLGIEQAQEEIEAEEAAGEEGEPPMIDRMALPPQMRRLYDYMEHNRHQVEVWRNTMELQNDQKELEGELKRKMADAEVNEVMDVIDRAPSLSFREAWTLVNHDKLLKDAVAKAAAAARLKQEEGRPRPIPGVKIPGTSLEGKKDPSKMNKAEWREHLRQTEDFRNLVKRG